MCVYVLLIREYTCVCICVCLYMNILVCVCVYEPHRLSVSYCQTQSFLQELCSGKSTGCSLTRRMLLFCAR